MTDTNLTETTETYFISENGIVRPMSEQEIIELENIREQAKSNLFVPNSITMRQLRLKLLNDNTLTTIVDAVNDLTSEDENIKIEWEYATDISIDGVLFAFIAGTLKLDDLSIKNFFIDAATL